MDALRNVYHGLGSSRGRYWIMTQTWHNLLFAHWAVPCETLEPLLPMGLQLDTFEGRAWVGVVAFRLSKIRLRGLPEFPFASHFPEVNVRTYVTAGGRPGVLFLSLDTDNPLVVALARPWFRLPYYLADVRFKESEGHIYFRSERRCRGECDARFEAVYGPCGPTYFAPPCTLDNWLTERYCYYAANRNGRTYRCDIQHPQWRLQEARADIAKNTMALAQGISNLQGGPRCLYAHEMTALIWMPVARKKDRG